jgi:hypothetical protein
MVLPLTNLEVRNEYVSVIISLVIGLIAAYISIGSLFDFCQILVYSQVCFYSLANSVVAPRELIIKHWVIASNPVLFFK